MLGPVNKVRGPCTDDSLCQWVPLWYYWANYSFCTHMISVFTFLSSKVICVFPRPTLWCHLNSSVLIFCFQFIFASVVELIWAQPRKINYHWLKKHLLLISTWALPLLWPYNVSGARTSAPKGLCQILTDRDLYNFCPNLFQSEAKIIWHSVSGKNLSNWNWNKDFLNRLCYG